MEMRWPMMWLTPIDAETVDTTFGKVYLAESNGRAFCGSTLFEEGHVEYHARGVLVVANGTLVEAALGGVPEPIFVGHWMKRTLEVARWCGGRRYDQMLGYDTEKIVRVDD